MNRKKIITCLMSIILLGTIGCTEEVPTALPAVDEPVVEEPVIIEEPEVEVLTDEEKYSILINSGTDLFYEVIKDSDENSLISPLSVYFALGMTENGAGKDTLSQMEANINGGISVKEENELLYDLSKKLRDSDCVSWGVANSIWYNNNGFGIISPDFIKTASDYYDAEVYDEEFDENTADKVNTWVNNKTNEMIPKIIDKVSPETKAILINAISFEGAWADPFEKKAIKDGIFTNANGSESKVKFLNSTESKYFTLNDGIGFVKPYEGYDYAFVGILPNEDSNVKDLVRNLSKEDLADKIKNTIKADVIVSMPKFEDDFSVDLKNVYKEMGVIDAFDPEKANFDKMFEKLAGKVWIDSIIHKTHIEVDQNGTKAAAVTAVSMAGNGITEPEELDEVIITLDRPFVYMIVDMDTGIPIFIGVKNTFEETQ